jgi:5-formyltetrahydrofolate cyclo-ligase
MLASMSAGPDTTAPLPTDKTGLRKKLRALRRDIPPQKRQALDRAINRELVAYAAQTQPRLIASYWPFDGEPDPMPALQALEENGTRIALPVIRGDAINRRLNFHHWRFGGPLRDNRYGIPEPTGTDKVPLAEIDLVLIPLVGWEISGGRLGLGLGFYDRSFEAARQMAVPVRMGVAYELQKTDNLPMDPWDIRLHCLLSENGVFTCPS